MTGDSAASEPVVSGDRVRSLRRGFRVARWSAASVFVVVAVLVAVLATRQPASEVMVQTPLVGKMAPPLAGRVLSGHGQASLADDRGSWVLVNFFASWCTVCKEEEPQLEQVSYWKPGGSGASPKVLGVLYGDTVADGIAFQHNNGAQWPAISDPGGRIASDWGVGSLPRSYLVDPQGRIVGCVLGGLTANQLEQVVENEAHRLGVPA